MIIITTSKEETLRTFEPYISRFNGALSGLDLAGKAGFAILLSAVNKAVSGRETIAARDLYKASCRYQTSFCKIVRGILPLRIVSQVDTLILKSEEVSIEL
jgi:hypothetical protein